MADADTKSLTVREQKALAALLTSTSLTEAAKVSGLGQRTIFRYLRASHFADAYRQARSEQVRQGICQIQRIAEKAAKVLEQIMDDPLAKPSARVLACRTILHTALQAVEIESLESRLDALEQKQNAQDDEF